MIRLIELDESWKEAFLEYQKAWGNADFVPYAAALRDSTFEEWLENSKLMHDKEFAYSKRLVPDHTFFLVDDESKTILGAINLRHQLNQYLYQYGGHIGYGIHPMYRGKGYGKMMLELALPLFRKISDEGDCILITCNKENIASAKVILSCGGVLENEVYNADSDEWICRYVIR